MRRILFVSLALVVALGLAGSSHEGDGAILVLDDCDPADPAWNATGGCTLKKGSVDFAEFVSQGFFGHPAWRFESSYLKVEVGDQVMVRNKGGRRHTFTEVANFGNGFVAGLNIPGLATIPECANPANVGNDMPAGSSLKLSADTPGTHRFQCCIHPWMRAAIKVEDNGSN
jgi:plastocyanin